ncbi:patatin-like phospholipase family protein [Sphingomonas endolithica]|uniref:patatin-like phospholipase family protein n=1 Tax=Sphingomonas endolithica TaxID=2972485 RepID=UPI0021AF3952|nr:patatin-like phospholipase family protein [Sphingomonas sp. ZFBP2030]
MTQRPFALALVLGGGNALGSYHAGVYQALHEHDYLPDWVVGTSAGAINGALIAGNAPEQRLQRLTDFWQPTNSTGDLAWWPSSNETLRRTSSVMATMATGRPGIFGAVGPLGSWWDPDPLAAAPSLFDSKPLGATLRRMVDFDRLNGGTPRFTAGAVDLESGDDVLFDSVQQPITADHIRASAALLPTFPPVEIDGRIFVDGGLSANLPLDPVLGTASPKPTLCVAVDLLPLAAGRPQTLGEAMGRAQDIIFAAQSRRTIERWRIAYQAHTALAASSMTLVRLAYADQSREVAGKGMDFSPESVRHRWQAGYRDAQAMLARVASGEIATGSPGLTVFGG